MQVLTKDYKLAGQPIEGKAGQPRLMLMGAYKLFKALGYELKLVKHTLAGNFEVIRLLLEDKRKLRQTRTDNLEGNRLILEADAKARQNATDKFESTKRFLEDKPKTRQNFEGIRLPLCDKPEPRQTGTDIIEEYLRFLEHKRKPEPTLMEKLEGIVLFLEDDAKPMQTPPDQFEAIRKFIKDKPKTRQKFEELPLCDKPEPRQTGTDEIEENLRFLEDKPKPGQTLREKLEGIILFLEDDAKPMQTPPDQFEAIRKFIKDKPKTRQKFEELPLCDKPEPRQTGKDEIEENLRFLEDKPKPGQTLREKLEGIILFLEDDAKPMQTPPDTFRDIRKFLEDKPKFEGIRLSLCDKPEPRHSGTDEFKVKLWFLEEKPKPRQTPTDKLEVITRSLGHKLGSPRPSSNRPSSFAMQTRQYCDHGIRHMYSEECEKAVNVQIVAELNAAYAYLGMSAHFGRAEVALPGCEGFFYGMHQEELGHAHKLIRYQNLRGGTVHLCPLTTSNCEEWSVEKAFNVSLEMEKLIKEKLIKLHTVAEESRDLHLMDFVVTAFIGEQEKSIYEFGRLLSRYRRMICGQCKCGEFLFDREIYESYVKHSTENLGELASKLYK